MIGNKKVLAIYLLKLADMKTTPQGNDEIVWPQDPKGFFTVKSFGNTLHDWSSCSDFPANAIWRSKAPPKVFFPWAATKEKMPTEDFL